jgi:hypothetical protein
MYKYNSNIILYTFGGGVWSGRSTSLNTRRVVKPQVPRADDVRRRTTNYTDIDKYNSVLRVIFYTNDE